MSESPRELSQQLTLLVAPAEQDQEAGEEESAITLTFRDSKAQPVHRWYPYVEGFSADYVRGVLLRYAARPRAVYDPFGGAGTTQLVASCLGIPSFYSEVNPFMSFVAETKVSSASWARGHIAETRDTAEKFLRLLTSGAQAERADEISLDSYHAAFPGRGFFEEEHAKHLLAARELALELTSDTSAHLRSLLLLACAANVVASSNMTRRADLRRRRSDEYKQRVVDVPAFIADSVRRMLSDLELLPTAMAPMTRVSEDCREIPPEHASAFDLAVTSPPYLNGTNYFRNTKLELWLLKFISSERDLAGFRRRAIAAGINNVSRTRGPYREFPSVEDMARKLDEASSDDRIPLLVRHYFSDMQQMFRAVYRSLRPGARFVMDIGDSRFYGVHVPTDVMLCEIAQEAGFAVDGKTRLARRYSYDKSELSQVELVLRRPLPQSRVVAETELKRKIQRFQKTLPYKRAPYDTRGWGHPLHSLCSYQGKLKPAIAHWLIREFVPPAGSVLDPLGGVGTLAFEAALLGCRALSNDKSPFPALIARAKLSPPSLADALSSLERISNEMSAVGLTDTDREAAKFGLNARVADYYHPETLKEVLRARRVFLLVGSHSSAEDFVWANMLHVLHGNRPYAVSRKSHPITPFHPSGPFVYKSLIASVRARITRLLAEPLPPSFRNGESFATDFRDLPGRVSQPVDAVITSPPFIGMRFDRPNWLRLWFLGWSERDFHETSLGFLERQQTESTSCYLDFFECSHRLLKPAGILIIHVGSGGRGDLVGDLRRLAVRQFALVGEAVEDVGLVERHGLRDKGLTKRHHFIFLAPKR